MKATTHSLARSFEMTVSRIVEKLLKKVILLGVSMVKRTGFNMKIWVDADACPNPIKDILFRAAKRTQTTLILVANTNLTTPGSPFILTVRVEHGFDRADDYIVQHMAANDLVVTADIPLAANVVTNKGIAINPRGELYTDNNIKQRLGLRNMMEVLRGSGAHIGGPSTFGVKEKTSFANALDRLLAKYKT